MAHFLCHLGCSHFGALLLDFYFTENSPIKNINNIFQSHEFPLLHIHFRKKLLYSTSFILLIKYAEKLYERRKSLAIAETLCYCKGFCFKFMLLFS